MNASTIVSQFSHDRLPLTIFFGLVLLMIYEGFYRSTTTRQPIAFAEVVSYIWLGQALLATLPWNPDAELRAMIRRTGS